MHTRAVRVMMRSLQEKAANRVSIAFEPNIAERGRKVADLLDLVKLGDLDLCYFSSSYLTKRVPALGVLDIPFQLTDRRDTRARLEGSLGAMLRREIAARTEYEVLAFWDNGLRNISNSQATDPQAGGLRRSADKNAAERGLSRDLPGARHGAGHDRRRRHGAGHRERRGRRAGKSAHEHPVVRAAEISFLRDDDGPFPRHRAGALQCKGSGGLARGRSPGADRRGIREHCRAVEIRVR